MTNPIGIEQIAHMVHAQGLREHRRRAFESAADGFAHSKSLGRDALNNSRICPTRGYIEVEDAGVAIADDHSFSM